ncbi:MAG: hypothetical protein C0594_08750 [Marinilabiliales bacterium]|nr:MAG: hypothetical protein C0594_08750 [Marinilabiliales bacterium]
MDKKLFYMEEYTGAKILVVDDTPTITDLMQDILSESGYNPILAGSGAVAKKQLNQVIPDIILLDIMMPEMNGYEFLEFLQSKKEYKDIPVIMVTAKTNVEDVQKALDLGAIDYIRKPIEISEFLARIRVALRLKHKEDSIRSLLNLKEQFISILSHDLRYPLISILEKAETIVYQPKIEDTFENGLINRIYNDTTSVVSYVDDMLTLLYENSEQQNVEKSRLQLLKLLIDTERLFIQKLKEKNIRLNTFLKETLTIYAERVSLGLFFRNLYNFLIMNLEESSVINIFSDDGSLVFQIDISSVSKFDKLNAQIIRLQKKQADLLPLHLKACLKIAEFHDFSFNPKNSSGKLELNLDLGIIEQ